MTGKSKNLKWIEMKKEEAEKFAKSFIEKSQNCLEMAKNYLEKAEKPKKMKKGEKRVEYAQSISEALECIEFALKAILLLFLQKYPAEHWIKEKNWEDFKKEIEPWKEEINKLIRLLSTSSSHLSDLTFEKLLAWWKLWFGTYIIAKYGDEKLKIPSEEIFDEKEKAESIIKDAEKCKEVARHLFNARLLIPIFSINSVKNPKNY